jgi:thiol-disulfide isomerase/thioredoxin
MVVFSILGIFSVRWRRVAKEAFHCVFRMIQFKPCDVKLEEKIKSKLTTKLMKIPKLARFIYKNFKIISWIFTIAFFASMFYTVYSLYNLAVYGSCSPGASCIFNPQGNITDKNVCVITAKFVEFYGQECPHCQKMAPIVEQVEKETGVYFEELEVWHNDTNRAEYLKHMDSVMRDCNLKQEGIVVPTFMSMKNNKSLCGEKTVEELKKFIADNG